MSTDYAEPIVEITDRILAILRLQRDADEALNDGVRPVATIDKGWPIRRLILQDRLPALYVHFDRITLADDYTGLLTARYHFTLSLIDNQLPLSGSHDTVARYIGELFYFVFARARQWELVGGEDLQIIDTAPEGVEVSTDNDVLNQSLVQADLRFHVIRALSLFEEV